MNHKDLCSYLPAQEVSAALAGLEVKPLPPAVVCRAPVVLVNSGQPQEDKMCRGCVGGRRCAMRRGALSWLLFHCCPLFGDDEHYLVFIALIYH